MTRREVVEAQAHDRRRLVLAFVQGASGGWEPEPERRGRLIVGSLALALALVAGVVVHAQVSRRDSPTEGGLGVQDPWHPAGSPRDRFGRGP